jgi:uncharacterized protein YcgI (DUF1989 family)
VHTSNIPVSSFVIGRPALKLRPIKAQPKIKQRIVNPSTLRNTSLKAGERLTVNTVAGLSVVLMLALHSFFTFRSLDRDFIAADLNFAAVARMKNCLSTYSPYKLRGKERNNGYYHNGTH